MYDWVLNIYPRFSIVLETGFSRKTILHPSISVQAPTRIVILSNQSLLVEGVIARLRQFQNRVDLQLVDYQQPGLLIRIITAQPDAILLDDRNTALSQALPLDRLFHALPALKVIYLNSRCPHTQIIRAEKYWVAEVCDLLDLIEPAKPEISASRLSNWQEHENEDQ